MDLIDKLERAKERVEKSKFPVDGLRCHCDSDVGACSCEICGEIQLLEDAIEEIGRLREYERCN